MFIPDAIFYEEKSYEYELGKRLLDNIKHPKNIKKPIALLGFVIKEKEK